MPSNQSGINDDELNQMIANLQRNQNSAGGAAAPAASAANNTIPGEKVIQPPAQTGANMAARRSDNPVDNLFNQPSNQASAGNTKINPAKPINLSKAGGNDAGDGPVEPTVNAAVANPVEGVSSDLESIRRQAIVELRPLVDKLDLPAEDKFDTLLLLIRTTDDSSLIPAAHTAAMGIGDDARRAQALLDVIKEIDFFGRK